MLDSTGSFPGAGNWMGAAGSAPARLNVAVILSHGNMLVLNKFFSIPADGKCVAECFHIHVRPLIPSALSESTILSRAFITLLEDPESQTR